MSRSDARDNGILLARAIGATLSRMWGACDIWRVGALAVLLVCGRVSAAERVWIDLDASIGLPLREVDDAYALLLAFRSPEFEVVGISSTYGNASVEQTTRVATELVRRFAVSPEQHRLVVNKGASSPSDLDGSKPACVALADELQRAGQPITYLALGPLTNLAAFLRSHPALGPQIRRIVFVGGRSPEARLAFGSGGVLRIHDANVWKDPAAARFVLHSAIPLTLIPVESASQLRLEPGDLHLLRSANSSTKYLADHSRTWMWFWTAILREKGAPVFDAAALISLVRPHQGRFEQREATVNAAGDLVCFERDHDRERTVRWCAALPKSLKSFVMRRLIFDR